LMWVSANPFQLGELVCYDLNRIFKQNGAPFSNGLSTDSLNILADPFLESQEYEQFLHFKATKQRIFDFLVYGRGTDLTPTEEQAFLASNPKSYITHQLLGELQLNRKQNAKAVVYFKQALALEVASENDRAWLRNKIAEAEEE
jgi:isopenicillin-N N-acyltransferase-like protein